MSEILAEYQGLGKREQFLTFAALVAFPTDVVALIKLLLQVIQFQQNNPFERPDAGYIGIPGFLWDTRIADALTLTILFYSTSIGVLLFYRWRLVSLARKKLNHNIRLAGGKKEYVEKYKRKPAPESENFLSYDLEFSANAATLAISSALSPFFLIWFRVFAIPNYPAFTLHLLTLLSLTCFTFTYLAFYDRASKNNYYLQSLFYQNYDRRFLRSTLTTGFWFLFVFLFVYRVDQNLSWEWALLFSTGTVAILLDCCVLTFLT